MNWNCKEFQLTFSGMQALTFVHLCMLKLEDALEISQRVVKKGLKYVYTVSATKLLYIIYISLRCNSLRTCDGVGFRRLSINIQLQLLRFWLVSTTFVSAIHSFSTEGEFAGSAKIALPYAGINDVCSTPWHCPLILR